jgi:hypothetical protein
MRRRFSVGCLVCGMAASFGHAACRVAPEAYGDPAAGGTAGTAATASTPASGGVSSTNGGDGEEPPSAGGHGGTGGAGAAGGVQSSPATPTAGAGDDSSLGVAGASATPDPAGSAGAPGDGGEPQGSPAGCSAQGVSFDEIRSGAVRANVKVSVTAIATSQKFLLSHTRSGGCLFGAFVGTEPDSEGPRGLLVVSYGEDAPEDTACPTGIDAIPDELAPGDVLTATGYLSTYAPSGCSAVPARQLLVDAACPLERTARTTPPEPFTLSRDQADAIARGSDENTLRAFAGGLVRLDDVTARRPAEGNGSVGPYGVIQLNETRLELHNDVAYGDLTLGGPGDPQKSLDFPYPQSFVSVTGIVHLDYCTWSLAPRDGCTDLSPPSRNCAD